METTYLLLFPITIVIVWLSVYFINRRYRVLHDRLFMSFMACTAMTYYICIHLLNSETYDYHDIVLDNIETLLGLSICPLLFLYIYTVFYDERWHQWFWWLFSPAIVIGTVGTVMSFIVRWDRIVEIRTMNFGEFSYDTHNLFECLYHAIDIRLFNLSVEVSTAAMSVLCIYLLFDNIRKAKHKEIKDCAKFVISSRVFLISSILNLLSYLLIALYIPELLICNDSHHLCISLAISLLLFLMAHSAYSIGESPTRVSTGIEMVATKKSDEVINPTQDNMYELLNQWQMREDKPYCREGITLADVAKEIHIHPRQVSAYINQNKGMNFRHWINTLRIEEAKRLMTENHEEKITYIAVLCGFADLSSFSKAFRSIEKCNPQTFKRNIEQAQ